MGKIYCLYLIQSLLECTIFYLIFSFIISIVIWYFSKNFNFQTFLKKPFTLSRGSITWNGDPLLAFIRLNFHTDFKLKVILNNFFVHFNLDGFGLVLLNLALFVGFISLLSLDTRFY